MTAKILSFETGRPAEITDSEAALVVDVEGYEGPLDLLLTLARQQKVDLAKISILALADQYLTFIEAARKIRLELAADYLVMAAWLAYLKSRLLLPEPPTPDGPSAEEMATALANRLRRLEAIREAANRLMNRPQFQRDIFPRGNPESIAEIRHPSSLRPCSTCSPPMPCSASSACWRRCIWPSARCGRSPARASLERLVGMTEAEDWSCLDDYLLSYVVDPSQRATVFASSFAAALELVREGEMELNQKEAFAPLYFRKRPPGSDARAGYDGRVVEGDLAMASLAEKRMEDAEDHPIDQNTEVEARPEELRLLEALLFASAEPIDQATLAKRMPDGVDVKAALAQLQAEYAPRGVNLVRVANKWTFRTAGDLSWLMTRKHRDGASRGRRSRCSRSSLSPTGDTRRDRGDPRRDHIKGNAGCAAETGWIRPRGRRKTPGRPLTFGTTEAFLSQFSLEALGDLPGLEELKGTGLLDSRLPSGFSVPTPSDDVALREDEDPLDAGDTLELLLAPAAEPEEGVELVLKAQPASPASGVNDSHVAAATAIAAAWVLVFDTSRAYLPPKLGRKPAVSFGGLQDGFA